MTYDQYEEYQANRPEEPKEPKSDAEQAWTDAYESDAYQRGLDDCFAGRERITEPSQPENAGERSQEYLETFARTYLECYNTGYDDGISELNPKSDVYYAGMSDAENAALQHAVKDAETESYKASFNETPTPREDGAPYLQDYLNGYAENYAEYYENFYYNTVENNMKMTLAHLGTLAANAESILTQHYPQTNWALIKALDPYYRVVGDADGDGDVTIMDATRIQRWLAELSDMDGSAFSGAKLTDTERMAADADGDGEVTIMDATRIQRWLAELDRSEYIGKAIA